MTVHQHAVSTGEFTHHLREVAALLDPGRGWYGVFCRRDPEGMRACLAGAEIPPWDVVESLFTDLAAVRGAAFAERASVRAAELYAASAAAHDRRPGGQRQLVERLELMRREQANAARRLSVARTGGEAGGADTEAVAWARDDHARASARCTELRRRLAAVAAPSDWFRAEGEPGPGTPEPAAPPQQPAAVRNAAADAADDAVREAPRPSTVRAGGPSRRKPRGARFAGLEPEEEPVAAAPVLPVPPVAAAQPRGARFGGAPRPPGRPPGRAAPAPAPAARPARRGPGAA
ncbi:hypothetical protein AB0D55_39545, partial [Streptomyces sp. NPDC048332]